MAVLFGCARTDVDSVPAACQELKPLADQPVLVPWPTYLTYFSPDRSFILLLSLDEPRRVVRVALPSGEVSTVADPIASVTSLGGGKAFLLGGTGVDRDETWLYDGNQVRPLYSGFCHVSATPDAAFLYAIGPCVGTENGLTRIDLATGTRLTIDPRARSNADLGIRVAPNGQWIAYGISDPQDSQRTIAVADAAGNVYPITTAQKVYLVEFVSDELMLFQTEGPPGTPGDMRGHVTGSGDTSFLIAADRSPGSDDSYEISRDRSQVLAVKRPDPAGLSGLSSIYSVPLDGGEPVLLVASWSSPFPDARPHPISFDSQGKYVLYSSYSRGDAAKFPLAVVDLQGSSPRTLSDDGGFILSPTTSDVVIVDHVPNSERSRLRLTDLATGRARLSYSSNADLMDVAVLRNGQAFLVVELEGYTTQRVRFVSAKHPNSVVIGEWYQARCRGCWQPVVDADPSGCFTVVTTDAPDNPGSRLVLLPE